MILMRSKPGECDPVFLFQMRAEEAVINRDKIFTPSTLLAQHILLY